MSDNKSLVVTMATKYGVDADKLLPTLKATAFKIKDGEATNEQMIALLIVANQYGLNPFTKEIFAFPDKQKGIIPVVGVDGWSRIINENPQFDGMEFAQSEAMVNIDADAKACPEWMECIIYRKDRSHAIKVREYLDEVYRPAFKGKDYTSKGPWQTHTKRFLRHKVTIQCARLAFGFAGIYDEDEAARIIEAEVVSHKITAKSMAEEDVSETKKADLRLIAEKVDDFMAEGDIVGAANILDANDLLIEEEVYLWTRLDSKVRSAIKKYQTETKKSSREAAAKNAAIAAAVDVDVPQ